MLSAGEWRDIRTQASARRRVEAPSGWELVQAEAGVRGLLGKKDGWSAVKSEAAKTPPTSEPGSWRSAKLGGQTPPVDQQVMDDWESLKAGTLGQETPPTDALSPIGMEGFVPSPELEAKMAEVESLKREAEDINNRTPWIIGISSALGLGGIGVAVYRAVRLRNIKRRIAELDKPIDPTLELNHVRESLESNPSREVVRMQLRKHRAFVELSDKALEEYVDLTIRRWSETTEASRRTYWEGLTQQFTDHVVRLALEAPAEPRRAGQAARVERKDRDREEAARTDGPKDRERVEERRSEIDPARDARKRGR